MSDKLALFTDIDDTLIARGGGQPLVRAAHMLHAQLAAADIQLIAVTGLVFPAVKARIDAGEIPLPQIVVSDVGTDIWHRAGSQWRQDTHYAAWLDTFGYKKSEVLLQAGRFIRDAPQSCHAALQTTPTGPYRVSVYFMASEADAHMLIQQAREFFAELKVIVCEEIHFNATLPPDSAVRKYCLDIMPATKADAVSYLVRELGITGGCKAGDSGNDIEMLLNPDSLTPILVGGYKPEASTAITPLLGSNHRGPLHFLQDGRQIYIENGKRRAAQSILHAMQLLGLIGRDIAA